jgi:hypothetical protein
MTSPTLAERIAALAVFAGVVFLFAVYADYLARVMVPLPTESAAAALLGLAADGAGVYARIVAAWQALAGSGLHAARLLSVLAALAGIVLLVRIGARLMADVAGAAFLGLGFVIYPPLVGTYAAATPHASTTLLALAALALLLHAAGRPPLAGVWHGLAAGALCALAVLLVPLANVLMPLWLLVCGAVAGARTAAGTALGVTLLTAVIAAAAALPVPAVDLDLAVGGQGSVLTALLMPYAMVVAVTMLGVAALASPVVRASLGLPRAVVMVAAPPMAFAVLLAAVATGALAPGQLTTAMGYAAPFMLLAPVPLIVWVRRVMPGVKSLLAWIVFPVIMYSCFWAILGPIDPETFPYSHRQMPQPGLAPLR